MDAHFAAQLVAEKAAREKEAATGVGSNGDPFVMLPLRREKKDASPIEIGGNGGDSVAQFGSALTEEQLVSGG